MEAVRRPGAAWASGNAALCAPIRLPTPAASASLLLFSDFFRSPFSETILEAHCLGPAQLLTHQGRRRARP